MQGAFITFEGGEGSGKSTQLVRLADYLEKKGYPVVSTREPGGTAIGTGIRSLLLDGKQVAYKTELFLCLADRAQHLQEVILPALSAHKVVLCDRFTDSTLIYQGYARGLDFPEMKALLSYAAEAVVPDLTFLFDIDIKKGQSRLKGRKEKNRLDQETELFRQKVRQGYLALAKSGPSRIHLIHADQTENAIFLTIQKKIDAFLP
jgi:dTMP kinase